jgi:hypothetical protein
VVLNENKLPEVDMRWNLRKLTGDMPRWAFTIAVLSLLLRVAAAESFSTEDYYRVDKIDVHFHIRTDNPEFVELAKHDRFRFVNIATFSADPEEMRLRHRTAFAQLRAHPDRVIVASSFAMTGWDDPDWADRTIRYLDETFAQGAVAVKVWKNIGMESKDKSGKVIMIDDPKLRPVLGHLAKKHIPLIGHLGEPRECWLPAERMVIHRGYYESHPQYHMFLHPEMPSYEDQLTARDRMLQQHPELKFSAAHLASLEWSVDELAKFLDRFPTAVAETAARVADLEYQSSLDHEKVRNFLIKYQDRVLYATDQGVPASTDPRRAIEGARRRWLADWDYFATSNQVEVRQLNEPVRGLQLPKSVVEKIYRLNAERFFDKAWKE